MIIPATAASPTNSEADNSAAGPDNGSLTPLSAARRYLARGWQPVPIPRGKKSPVLKSWQGLRLTDADLGDYFSGQGNIGLLLGEPSNRLIDVDLDAAQAVALADSFLPRTGLIHGRPGKPASHRWYVVTGALKTEKFQDVDSTMLLEVRSTGAQTVVPPSQHPSGEILSWVSDAAPECVEPAALRLACARLAAWTLAVRHWPNPTSAV